MTANKRKPDPVYTLRLLSVINKVRNRRQRPSTERVVSYMMQVYGLPESEILAELNAAVKADLIIKCVG